MKIIINFYLHRIILLLGLINYSMLVGTKIGDFKFHTPDWWLLLTTIFGLYLIVSFVGLVEVTKKQNDADNAKG